MIRLSVFLLALALSANAASGATPEAPAAIPEASPLAPEARLAGVLMGTVTDAATGESLPGATVRIEGTSIGAATDIDGRYRIARIPEGPQTIIVSYIGYRTVEIERVIPDGTVTLDVELALDTIEGETVTISAQAEGQVAAINDQLNSNRIVSVVSAARLQELPDANAAESVGRLPGISIQRDAGEGQNVVIRGLSPKYNNVTVNGVNLPSTSFDTRSTNLNSISSEMLAGVEVYKSLTPDQDADAIGGSVNFRLRGAPNGFQTRALLQGGYNDINGSFGQYKGNASVSNRFMENRLGVFVQGNLERVDRSSERISANYLETATAADEDEVTLSITDVDIRDRDETRDRYGASLMLDYRLPSGTIQWTTFANRLDRAYISRDNTYNPLQATVTYDINDVQLQTDIISSAISGDLNLADLAEFTFTLNAAASNIQTPFDSRVRFRENSAFDIEALDRLNGPGPIQNAAVANIDNTFFERLDFAREEGSERDLGAQANVKAPFNVGQWLTGYLKTGGKYRFKTRSNDNDQEYLYTFFGGENGGLDELAAIFPDAERSAGGQIGLRSFLDDENSGGNVLGGAYTVSSTPRLDQTQIAFNGLRGDMRRAIWGDFEDFDADEAITAGYVMTELNFGPRILLLPGVRYEHTNTSYDAFFGRVPQLDTPEDAAQVILRDTSSVQSYGNWFPMAQLRVRPTDWFDVRLSYTETQSRPDFEDTSPRLRIRDDNGGRIDKGNPGLRPALAQNVDAYLSFYSNRVGLFSVGGFYKRIEGVIYNADIRLQDLETTLAEGYTREFQGYQIREPRNLETPTEVRGIEVDWQSNLLWLPGVLNGIVINANVSRIFSETEIQRVRSETVFDPFPRQVFESFQQEVALLDQPDWIANVAVGYDTGPFSGRVSVLYQEGNLTGYGSTNRNLTFFDTYVRWDAQASYRLQPSLSLYAQLNNLTNRPDLSLKSTGRFTEEDEVYGRSFNIGLRFRP